MILKAFILFVLVIWLIYEAILWILSERRRAKLRHLYRVESTRTHFAKAREELVNIVREGKLDPRSHTFRFLNGIHTTILRRPEQYREISQAILESHLKPDDTAFHFNVEDEIPLWNAQVYDVFKQTAAGFDCLLYDYSPFLRILRRLSKLLGAGSTIVRALEKISERTQNPEAANLKAARNAMLELVPA